MKNSNRKIAVVAVIVLFILILVVFAISKNKKEESKNINNTTVEIISNTIPDEETPEDIAYIKISNENKILSSMIIGEFENGKNLSTEQYLKVVYNALNNNYINLNKNIYTEEEINNIVYSIFNVKLTENKSIEGLSYNNGEYTFEKKETNKIELNNVERDTAVGSTYIEFEIENEKYIAKITTNSVTGEDYINSIIKN